MIPAQNNPVEEDPPDEGEPEPPLEGDGAVDAAGQVNAHTIEGLPAGFHYGVTRYADVILQEAFPARFADIVRTLEQFSPSLDELLEGGGSRTPFVQRFDQSLEDQLDDGSRVWGKQTITIWKAISFEAEFAPDRPSDLIRTRGHEIDMFGMGTTDNPFPGVAVEMEWNNKDPFFDRDLLNFQALHHEGAIGVGVIVTRGPVLQARLRPLLDKYGQSTTNWDKLVPRVNLGGGGECPLLLIGIEPETIDGHERLATAFEHFMRGEAILENWRERYDDYEEARRDAAQFAQEAKALLADPD